MHTFGWAIVINIEEDNIIDCYPARVKFRGFDNKSEIEGFIKVSDYLKNNIDELNLEEEE